MVGILIAALGLLVASTYARRRAQR